MITRDPDDNDPFEGFSGDYVPQSVVKEPAPDETRLCIVCAYDKPWGVWDSKTGAAVCKDCRDAARSQVRSAWVIRRGNGEDAEFLAVSGMQRESLHDDSGVFTWLTHPAYALRFGRRDDAVLVFRAVRRLMDNVPHGQTLPTVRSGDTLPEVVEHLFV